MKFEHIETFYTVALPLIQRFSQLARQYHAFVSDQPYRLGTQLRRTNNGARQYDRESNQSAGARDRV